MKYFPWTTLGFLFVLFIASSSSLAADVPDKPVARVFDQLIYPSDILPPQNLMERQQAQFGPDELAKWKKEYQLKKLEHIIYFELQKDLLNKTNMQPTEAEVQQHIAFSIKNDENRLDSFEAEREGLINQLKAAGLEEGTRINLKENLQTLEQLIASEMQRQEEKKQIPNYPAIKEKSLRRIAHSMVTAWKYNKALYQEYGGRVIFQQFGFEPIDAMKTFLDEHKAAQTFQVFDPDYDQLFDRMYRYFEMGHSYMDQDAADQYFSIPWWDPAFEPL